MTSKPHEPWTFPELLVRNCAARAMHDNGASAGEIAGMLGAMVEDMLGRVMELESIAPRAIKMSNGRVMIWRCPEELIPITDFNHAEESTNAEEKTDGEG